jgi:hypothetical protein
MKIASFEGIRDATSGTPRKKETFASIWLPVCRFGRKAQKRATAGKEGEQ